MIELLPLVLLLLSFLDGAPALRNHWKIIQPFFSYLLFGRKLQKAVCAQHQLLNLKEKMREDKCLVLMWKHSCIPSVFIYENNNLYPNCHCVNVNKVFLKASMSVGKCIYMCLTHAHTSMCTHNMRMCTHTHSYLNEHTHSYYHSLLKPWEIWQNQFELEVVMLRYLKLNQSSSKLFTPLSTEQFS